jgi:hypothetical protein
MSVAALVTSPDVCEDGSELLDVPPANARFSVGHPCAEVTAVRRGEVRMRFPE